MVWAWDEAEAEDGDAATHLRELHREHALARGLDRLEVDLVRGWVTVRVRVWVKALSALGRTLWRRPASETSSSTRASCLSESVLSWSG